tara:strand:+ start:1060 stop:1431 length:372 start_codon:yes stop_codon:yes gene_type:complete
MEDTFLEIRDIKLWSRVGVLDEERILGQLFTLDIFLWSDFTECTKKDDVNFTIDYSVLINEIKAHSRDFSCLTIERYSSVIIKIIKERFNPTKIKIKLTKCNPPINGFKGDVSIVRISESKSK